jgi:hypothetical protein
MKREQNKVKALFIELIRSPLQTFPEYRGKLNAPAGKGVYVIYDPRGRVAHVGSTPRAVGGIAQRLRNHMAGASSFTRAEFNRDGSRLRGKYKFRCIEVRAKRHRALLEAYAIGSLCPTHIGIG